jgi:hypothetical protein
MSNMERKSTAKADTNTDIGNTIWIELGFGPITDYGVINTKPSLRMKQTGSR